MHTLVICALTLGPAAPALKDKPAPDPLLGRWEATGLVVNMKPDPQWPGLEYEFAKDGVWIIYRDGREQPDVTRSYTVHRKSKPAAIDLTEHGRDPYPGVYEVGPDGATLTVSFNIAKSGVRPTGIAPADGTMTITFKKATKGK